MYFNWKLCIIIAGAIAVGSVIFVYLVYPIIKPFIGGVSTSNQLYPLYLQNPEKFSGDVAELVEKFNLKEIQQFPATTRDPLPQLAGVSTAVNLGNPVPINIVVDEKPSKDLEKSTEIPGNNVQIENARLVRAFKEIVKKDARNARETRTFNFEAIAGGDNRKTEIKQTAERVVHKINKYLTAKEREKSEFTVLDIKKYSIHRDNGVDGIGVEKQTIVFSIFENNGLFQRTIQCDVIIITEDPKTVKDQIIKLVLLGDISNNPDIKQLPGITPFVPNYYEIHKPLA